MGESEGFTGDGISGAGVETLAKGIGFVMEVWGCVLLGLLWQASRTRQIMTTSLIFDEPEWPNANLVLRSNVFMSLDPSDTFILHIYHTSWKKAKIYNPNLIVYFF